MCVRCQIPKKTIPIRIISGHADVEWFDEFMQHCDKLDCRIDYIATHLYTGKKIDTCTAEIMGADHLLSTYVSL